MKRTPTSSAHRLSLIVGLIAGLALLGPATQALVGQGNPNPRILPPNSAPYGLTYGEWSAVPHCCMASAPSSTWIGLPSSSWPISPCTITCVET